MENQEQKKKECRRCGNFDRYYTKGLRHYEKTECGFCREQHKIVDQQEYCDCWRTNGRKHFVIERLAAKKLNELLMEISALRQIIEENEEENKY